MKENGYKFSNIHIQLNTLQLCYQSYIMHWYFMQFHAEGSFSVQWDRSEQCDHSLCSAVHIVRGWHCSRLDTNRFCIAQRLFLTFTFYVHFHHPAWQQGSNCYNLQMLQHMLRITGSPILNANGPPPSLQILLQLDPRCS